MGRIFRHYHSNMCKTDVWVPSRSFHILSKVYVHFHHCVFCHTVTSYGLHVLCWLATVNIQMWGCGHCFNWAESNNKRRWQQLCLGSRELCTCDDVRRKSLWMKLIFPQGRISLTNVSERKEKMRLGMTLTSNPKDNSFVVRMPFRDTFHDNTLFLSTSGWNVVKKRDCSRILDVVCLRCSSCIPGLWALVVLWMWQLVLQHWDLLQS